MAFRKLDNIDEKIIEATIALGASTQGGRGFATKDIAERCHISEYVIFKHFGNKQNLLALADKKVGEMIAGKAANIASKTQDAQEFSLELLDWLIKHPDIAFFSLNYGHGIPHASETILPKDDSVNEKWIAKGKEILNSPKNISDLDYLLSWQFLLRNVLYFTGFILLKNIDDTPEERTKAIRILADGAYLTRRPGHE
jgi:AcrR family transcriptional regulator